MGGGASKRVVPSFTVTIVFNHDLVTTIDVAETATLSEARKEVELEAKEFEELPQNGKFYFLFKGTNCSKRNESKRTVREGHRETLHDTFGKSFAHSARFQKRTEVMFTLSNRTEITCVYFRFNTLSLVCSVAHPRCCVWTEERRH